MTFRALRPLRQGHHIAFLFFLGESIHYEQLLPVMHGNIQPQKTAICVHFKGIRILVERLCCILVTVNKYRNIHAGAGALPALGHLWNLINTVMTCRRLSFPK